MRISDWSSDVCSSDLGAVDVELRRVDPAQRRVQAEAGLAVILALPRPQRAQHLGGEGFVDLVQVEVLQAQPVALQHLRHGDGRRHQQAFAVDEVDRRGLRVADVAQHLVAVRGRRSEEHTSELQSLMRISYAVFCLKKKKKDYQ